MCFTCRVRISRVLYTYNSNSDRSDEIRFYNSNYVPFPFDMTPPFSHFYSVTSNSNLNFTENHFSQRDIETCTPDFRRCFSSNMLKMLKMGVKNRRLIKQIKLGLLVVWRILTLGWEIILNTSYLPLKLPFSANYLFFGPSLIVYKPQALSSDVKATGRGLLTGYRWDT